MGFHSRTGLKRDWLQSSASRVKNLSFSFPTRAVTSVLVSCRCPPTSCRGPQCGSIIARVWRHPAPRWPGRATVRPSQIKSAALMATRYPNQQDSSLASAASSFPTSMPSLLITGACGYIGRHLIPFLAEQGEFSITAVSSQSQVHSLFTDCASPVKAVCSELSDLSRAPRKMRP